VSEEKNRLVRTLERLHLGYWIVELLLSSGAWSLAGALIQQYIIPIPPHVKWPLLLLLVGGSMYFLDWRRSKSKSPLQQVQSSTALMAGNANDAQNAKTPFPGYPTETLAPGIDIDKFFRNAYRSLTLEREAQKNMRILARQRSPDNIELFYLELIGVGLMASMYDSIWYLLFRSQLLALIEINRNNGILPLSKVKTFYDAAAQEYPEEYAKENFDRWLSYLIENQLVIKHPSEMVEISVRGKDFLKYLTHWGREPKDKRL
jgi:hypothetical protein